MLDTKEFYQKLKPAYQQIWDEALPYQDVRDDLGHAQTVTEAALDLLNMEQANEEVVVPAAILHDIGWSQMSKEERLSTFKNRLREDGSLIPSGEKVPARIKHEQLGSELARKILQKLNYNPEQTEKVITIIGQHDTNKKEALDINDAVMKDADKLWTFTVPGIEADLRRFGFTLEKAFTAAEERINRENYLHTESGKQIARQRLAESKQEMIAESNQEIKIR